MGQLFTYIADDALRTWPYGTCSLCDRADVAAYPYSGFMMRKDGRIEELEAVCADCLRSHSLQWANESELPAVIRQSGELLARLRQTPQIPLMMQYFDWPVCCGDLCEFSGSPAAAEELVEIRRTAVYWERGLGKQGRDFAESGAPESLREVSVFGCHACGKRYWIDQFT